MTCVCGHHEDLHEVFRPRGKPAYRRKCSVWAAGAKCTCTRFEDARSLLVERFGPASVVERERRPRRSA